MCRRTLVIAFAVLACLAGRVASSAQSAPATPRPTPPSSNVTPAPSPTPRCKSILPPRLVHKVDPGYPAALRKQRVEGRVTLQGIITTDGSVDDIAVSKSPSNDLTELAI